MNRKLPGPTLAWVALAAAVVTAWLYRGFIFDGHVMLWGREMVDQSYALREFAVREIQAGRGVPLWNPYLFGGLPYVAILPGPVFYPTTALYFTMPLFRAIGWTFVFHTWLAALFGYFAARSLDLNRAPSAVAGFAFMLTGFAVSMNEAGHDGRMFAIVLIALAFGCLERGLRSGKIRWFLGMGLAVACQILTPQLQVMYFSSLALSLYTLLRLIGIARADGDWRPAARLFGFFAVGFATAALVGMAQLLPNLVLTRYAVRGGGESGYAFAASWAMPPQELTGFVLPDLIGMGPLQPGARFFTYWGSNPFKQHTEYLGIVPAALAIIGLTGARKDRRVAVIGAVALLCVLFALGAATPVHRIAYYVVPMIKKLRAASMMLAPASLFLALLAGFGWQRVLDARDESGGLPWGWIVGLSALPLLLGLAAALSPDGLVRWVHTSWYANEGRRPTSEGVALLRIGGMVLVGVWGTVWAVAYGVARDRLPPRPAVLALLALLVLDLSRVDGRFISVVPPEQEFATDTLQRALHEEIDPVARVFPVPEQGGYAPNAMMLHDIRAVTGMQNFRLRWTDRLLGGLNYENLFSSPALWPALDIDYLLTRQEADTPLLERGPSGPSGTAWHVTADGPHAWFPGRVLAEPDSDRAIALLRQRSDPASFALVATGNEVGAGPTAGRDSSTVPAGQGTATVTHFEPDEVVLDVDAERAGLLVVSEIYHPNWHATVDGRKAPVLRVDVALRGVEVPAGQHEVRFKYAAGTVRGGLVVGLLALLVAAVGILVDVRSEQTGRAGDASS